MKDRFCGWYFKCQSDRQTLAVIPSIHTVHGQRFSSIQLIADDASWHASFPGSLFRTHDTFLSIGKNRFSPQGLHLDLRSPGLHAVGDLSFGPLTPLRYDIMGPFSFVPFLECRHRIYSIKHTVTGEIRINDIPYVFRRGAGYLEGDRGSSFPKEYVWTQCSFPGGALMLSVADIPLGLCRFTGVISVILLQGREYRLATYLGAKAVKIEGGDVTIRQGNMTLSAKLIEPSGHRLQAPVGGAMARTIHEHPSCRAFYRLQKGNELLFQQEVSNASFEYEYPL